MKTPFFIFIYNVILGILILFSSLLLSFSSLSLRLSKTEAKKKSCKMLDFLILIVFVMKIKWFLFAFSYVCFFSWEMKVRKSKKENLEV